MHSLQRLPGNRDRKMQGGEVEICEGIHKINSVKDKTQRKWVRQRRMEKEKWKEWVLL